MAKYTFATLPAWAAKVQKIATAVASEAATNVADVEVAPGITKSGSRQKGVIPYDTRALAKSLQIYLNNSNLGGGEGSHRLVLGAMEAGDVVRFSWGATAPYAQEVHYGANGVPGTFWIDVAAAKWPGYVSAAVARAKAQVAG